MSERPIQLFVATFGDEVQAGQVLKDFQSMDREGSIDLIDAAVIVHTQEGKVNFEETADPGAKTWGTRGAIAGGVVGLLFPPASSPRPRLAGVPARSGAGTRQGLHRRAAQGDR